MTSSDQRDGQGADPEASGARPLPGTQGLGKAPLGRGVGGGAGGDDPPIPAGPEPRWIPIEQIIDTEGFRLRPVEEVPVMAESVARQGQRVPISLRPVPGGFQIVAGHRRLAAARLLQRRKILARVFQGIGEAEAAWLALVDDLDRRPWRPDQRAAAAEALSARGLLSSKVQALLARAEALAPEGATPSAQPPEEAPTTEPAASTPSAAEASASGGEQSPPVEALPTGPAYFTLNDLAQRTRDGLADACHDLDALLARWAELPDEHREDLLACLRYVNVLSSTLEEAGAASEPSS